MTISNRSVTDRIAEINEEMREWRHDFHMHPELRFEEFRTSRIVKEKLLAWGFEVHEGLGGTGVVGVLKSGVDNGKSIGIRADMDALPLQEIGDHAHRSLVDGKMHACGHDGHTATLLGAAKYLAETKNFSGTINLIFQPGEEGGAGAQKMIEDGLFRRFPCDAIYGLHNMPQIPAGEFGIRKGPLMAARDNLEITVHGNGGHAAMPHLTVDPISISVQIYTAAQTFVSRELDPFDNVVISITQFHAGTANNIIPDTASLSASIRTMNKETQSKIRDYFQRLCNSVADQHGIEITCDYIVGYPVTVNNGQNVDKIVKAAKTIAGEKAVDTDCEALMGSEDFSYMLEACPGAYIFLGGGDDKHQFSVHNPRYDYNDDILKVGATLWATLVEQELPM